MMRGLHSLKKVVIQAFALRIIKHETTLDGGNKAIEYMRADVVTHPRRGIT